MSVVHMMLVGDGEQTNHVFISYNHAHQDMIKQIKDRLKVCHPYKYLFVLKSLLINYVIFLNILNSYM